MTSEKDFEKKITEIETTEKFTDKKQNQKKEKSTKSPKLSTDDTATKIFTIFSLPYLLTKKQNIFRVEDFKTEAEALNRTAEQYPIIKRLLLLFEPITIVTNILIKIKKNADLNKTEKNKK